jgi:hypothetical protein
LGIFCLIRGTHLVLDCLPKPRLLTLRFSLLLLLP